MNKSPMRLSRHRAERRDPQGDPSLLAKLAATMVDFDPRFEIMHGTQAAGVSVTKANPYEAISLKPLTHTAESVVD